MSSKLYDLATLACHALAANAPPRGYLPTEMLASQIIFGGRDWKWLEIKFDAGHGADAADRLAAAVRAANPSQFLMLYAHHVIGGSQCATATDPDTGVSVRASELCSYRFHSEKEETMRRVYYTFDVAFLVQPYYGFLFI